MERHMTDIVDRLEGPDAMTRTEAFDAAIKALREALDGAQSAARWAEMGKETAITETKALRQRVADLEALVMAAYQEGWAHGAASYGANIVGMIEHGAKSDWINASRARDALHEDTVTGR